MTGTVPNKIKIGIDKKPSNTNGPNNIKAGKGSNPTNIQFDILFSSLQFLLLF